MLQTCTHKMDENSQRPGPETTGAATPPARNQQCAKTIASDPAHSKRLSHLKRVDYPCMQKWKRVRSLLPHISVPHPYIKVL